MAGSPCQRDSVGTLTEALFVYKAQRQTTSASFKPQKYPLYFDPNSNTAHAPFGGRYIVAARPRPGIYIRTALVIPACGRTTGSLSQPFIAARYKATHSQLFLQHPLLFPRHDFLGFTEVLNRNHRPAILQESDHPSNHRRTR